MARWSRSRLRNFGIGAVALLGGSLLVIPAISEAGDEPVKPKIQAAAQAPDRISVHPGGKGKPGFQFKPSSGDVNTPYGFLTDNGQVEARRLSGSKQAVAKAKVSAPRAGRKAAPALKATAQWNTITIQSENWSAWGAFWGIWNRDTWTRIPINQPTNTLSLRLRLNPGNYWVGASYGISGQDSFMLTRAFSVGNAAQTLTLNEKAAKEIGIKVDDPAARRDSSVIWTSLPGGDLFGFGGGTQAKLYASPTAVSGATLRVHELLVRSGSSALKPSPYRYDLTRYWPYPRTASVVTYKTSSLAKTSYAIRAPGANVDSWYWSAPRVGNEDAPMLASQMRAPGSITEYVTPGVEMYRSIDYGLDLVFSLPNRTLTAGTHPGQSLGAGPLSPGSTQSRRTWDMMTFDENATLSDTAGNLGFDAYRVGTSRLSRNGTELASSNDTYLTAQVPGGEQTFRFEQTTSHRSTVSQLSTKVTSDWTFVSNTEPSALLPLMDLSLASSGLDVRNRAGSAPVRLTVKPSTRVTEAENTVDKVEWSANDGATWTGLPLTSVTGGAQVSITVPAATAFGSLRITASNDEGGKLTRTIVRAFGGPAVAGDDATGATITNIKVNDGKPVIVGTAGEIPFSISFTANASSGVRRAGLSLWHGNYNTPDGVFETMADCGPPNGNTMNCTAHGFLYDVRYSLPGNVLAGAWNVRIWAQGNDLGQVVDRHKAATLAFKQATMLSTDATPEPVVRGGALSITGLLRRADWDSWTYKPFANQQVRLQWIGRGDTVWNNSMTEKSDAAGKIKSSGIGTMDASHRFVYSGSAAHNQAISVADYVDVL